MTDRLHGPGLVSVVGPAGVGKSRVAAEVVRRLRGETGREIRWVSLEVVTEQALVPPTVALALGLSPGDDPFASIVGELAPYGPLVLVLDGCEAALDGAATLAGELVVRCPQLTLLATTRLPLGCRTRSSSTSRPGRCRTPTPTSRRADPTWTCCWRGPATRQPSVARADRAILGSLLRHCGGIPLAIELVAAQLATDGRRRPGRPPRPAAAGRRRPGAWAWRAAATRCCRRRRPRSSGASRCSTATSAWAWPRACSPAVR